LTSLDSAFVAIGRENNYKDTPSLLDIFRDDNSIASTNRSNKYKSSKQRPRNTRPNTTSYGENNSDFIGENKRSYKSVLTGYKHKKSRENDLSSTSRVTANSFSKESLDEIKERFQSARAY
jgi:hypothetical protein